LHLELQLLVQLRNQALQFTMEIGVLLLLIGSVWLGSVTPLLLTGNI
jgi:hypothetical protein